MRVLGVDFTSAPRRAKPIVVARGVLDERRLHIDEIAHLDDFAGFEALLREPGPWVGGFDFPFGFSRELVVELGWPLAWPALIRHFAALDHASIETTFAAFRARRPVGGKYAHRAGDAASGAHASMKLVNPPVAWMLREGATRLLDAGVHIPALYEGDRGRVALEAYPGLAMRHVATHAGWTRAPSYKNDAPMLQTAARREARIALLDGLLRGGHRGGVPTHLAPGLGEAAIDDGRGDTLDAIAACTQAAWGARRADASYGLPAGVDPVEGWIVTA